MSSTEIIAVIAIVATLLNGMVLFIVNRAFRNKDKRNTDIDTALDNNRQCLKDFISKLQLIERDIQALKEESKDDKEEGYIIRKNRDSVRRCHLRIDDLKNICQQLRDRIQDLDKEIVKVRVSGK